MPHRRFADRALRPDLGTGDLLDRFRNSLEPEWINEALAATGTATIRRRRLPAEQVVWLVLGMGIYRNVPIAEIVAQLDLALPGRRGPRTARSSVTQARERLGDEPIRWLFERCGEEWAHGSALRHAWRGLAVYGVDGTTVRLPDSEANREHFGYCVSCRGESAYPMAHDRWLARRSERPLRQPDQTRPDRLMTLATEWEVRHDDSPATKTADERGASADRVGAAPFAGPLQCALGNDGGLPKDIRSRRRRVKRSASTRRVHPVSWVRADPPFMR